MSVAPTLERFEELKRGASMARVFGLQVDIIDRDRIAELVPLARVDDLVGGVHLPNDGITNPIDTTQALAKGARARGVRVSLLVDWKGRNEEVVAASVREVIRPTLS